MLVRQRQTVAEVFVDHVHVTRGPATIMTVPMLNVLCCGLSPSGNLLATASAHSEPNQSVIMAHEQFNRGLRSHILVPWIVLKIAINNSGSCFGLVIKMDGRDEIVVAYSTKRHKILTIYAGVDTSINNIRFVTDNCLNIDKSIVFVDMH